MKTNKVKYAYYYLGVLTLVSLLFILLTSFDQSKCPQKGLGKNRKDQISDSLKNRYVYSANIKHINFNEFTNPGNDVNRFKQSEFVETEAYVYDVKYSEKESCECKVDDKDYFDIHIKLIDTSIIAKAYNTDNINEFIVVGEINRFSRDKDYNPTTYNKLQYDQIKQLKGKKVKIVGYLFFDEEHSHNSYNTGDMYIERETSNGKMGRYKNKSLWRRTAWEIHPILNIQEIK